MRNIASLHELLKLHWPGLFLTSVILALLPVYYVYFQAEGFGLHHDDGVYLVTAKSLAENGRYSIESLPSPIAQTKYPILYPLLLAPLWKIFSNIPQNFGLLRLSSLVFVVIWFLLIYKYVRRRYSPELACISVIFVAISHFCIYLWAGFLPDILFALLCLGSVLLADKAIENSGVYKYTLGSALLAAFAFLVSTKGIAVIVAGLMALGIYRKWKHLFLFGGCISVLCFPWLLWQARINAPLGPVLQYYSKASYAAGHIFGNCSVSQALNVIVTNTNWLAQGFVYLGGVKNFQETQSSIIPAGFAFLGLVGFVLSVRQRISAADLWVLVYLGMLVCWVWQPYRYQVPLLPLFLAYVGLAIRWLMAYAPKIMRPKALAIVMTALLLISAGHTTYKTALVTWKKSSPSLEVEDVPDEWQATKDLCNWIRKNTEPQSIIAANLDPVVYLLTGRKSVRSFAGDPYLLFYSNDPDRKPLGDAVRLRKHILQNRITYFMITPMHNFGEASFLYPLFWNMIQQYPGCARLVATGKESTAQIWKIDLTKLADPASAMIR